MIYWSCVLMFCRANWQKQCNLLSNIFIICAGLFMFKLNKTYLIHCINNIYLIKQNLSQEYSSVYIIGLSWEGWIRICIDVPAYIPKWNTGTKELELAILSHFRYDWVMVMQVKWSCYLFGFCCYDPKLNWGCCSMVKEEISFIMDLIQSPIKMLIEKNPTNNDILSGQLLNNLSFLQHNDFDYLFVQNKCNHSI